MWKIIRWLLLAIAIYIGVFFYAGYTYGQKAMQCMEREQPTSQRPPTRAQMQAVFERVVICTDKKANALERYFFNKEKMLRQIRNGEAKFKYTTTL
jgi:hypothetical protein